MKSVGIDIGSYSIKIAEIESSSHGATLYRYEEYPINPDPNADRHLLVIEALRNIMAQYNHEEVNFVVAMNQNHVTHRRTFFPFKERHSIQKALALDIEDEVPFTMENGVFDGKILSYLSGGGANVLASISLKERIGEMIQTCKDSGFDPHIISCESLAYSNLFENWNELPPSRDAEEIPDEDEESSEETQITVPKSDAGVLVHIGNEKTILLAYQNKELLTCRTYSWGAKEMAVEVQKKYQIPLSEAYRELESKSFVLLQDDGATEAQATFSKTLEKPLTSLAKHLRLAFLELESELQINITKCSLTGGGAKVKNIGPFLTQHLEVATNPLDPELSLVQNRAQSFNRMTGGVALGLAIEGVKKPRNPAVNFLKGEFARKNLGFERFKERWGHALQMSAVAFCILVVHSCMKSNISESIYEDAQDNLRSLAKKEKSIKRASSRSIKSYIKKKKQLKTKVKDLEKINKINSAMDVVSEISKLAPSSRSIKLDITRLKIADEDVQIIGYVDQRDSIQALEKALSPLSTNKSLKKLSVRMRQVAGKKSFAYTFKTSRTEKGL